VTSVSGTVVARYKRHCLVADTDGKRVNCQLERRRLKPVVGDTVQWQSQADTTGTLTSIAPRTSELTRIDSRGRPEVIAANLSQLVIVLAPDPAPDWFLLDRYLAAAELVAFKAVIAFNKIDLGRELPAELDEYAELGYASCQTSATKADGLEKLTEHMAGERSVMIGQSGVGKSSLLNALLGDTLQAVGALSEKGGHGRHTTSTAVLYELPENGELIDSPGVRDYSPYIADPRDVASGFREFKSLANACRFQDCSHLVEPDCAIKAALMAGDVLARRFASYERLYALTESLQGDRY